MTKQVYATKSEIDEQMGKAQPLRVALSNYHNGQIVKPYVIAGRIGSKDGHEVIRVVLSWFNGCGHTYSWPTRFDGTRNECERWLMDQVIHLDAQGIH